MDIVRISAYACGYHSDAEYEEDIFITKDFYEIIKNKVEGLEFYIGELDGKHSETEADIEVTEYTEEELLTTSDLLDNSSDNNSLYYELEYLLKDNNVSLEEEVRKVRDYLDTLDTIINFEATIKKSQKIKVLEFIKSLQ